MAGRGSPGSRPRPKGVFRAAPYASQRKTMPARLKTSIRIAPRYEDGVYGSGELMGEVCADEVAVSNLDGDRRSYRAHVERLRSRRTLSILGRPRPHRQEIEMKRLLAAVSLALLVASMVAPVVEAGGKVF